MTGRCFLDSNILVYTDDRAAPAKQAAALDLLEQHRRAGTGVISTQVLQEYFVAATRKLGVEPAAAQRKVALFARLHLVQVDLDIIMAAIDLQRLHQISFWDALIGQAALAAGCTTLLTEDLQHGAALRGLRVLNPFAVSP